MKKNKRIESIIRAKVQWNHDHTELCGCFSYAEIIYLVENINVKVEDYQQSMVAHIKVCMKSGINRQRWFYFKPKWNLRKPEKKHDILSIPSRGVK